MKKLGLMLFASLLLFSCNNKKQNEVVTESESVEITDSIATPDASTAQSALDYQGTYEGILPAADAAGINITITLTDSTYTKKESFIGKKNSDFTASGKYKWASDGSIIILEGTEEPNQYFVQEGALIQLDTQGKKIEGALADKYILKKK